MKTNITKLYYLYDVSGGETPWDFLFQSGLVLTCERDTIIIGFDWKELKRIK